VYDEYYKRHGADRNDILANPEVVFQSFAVDRANIAALRATDLDRPTARVLDVGCGSGSSLIQFVKLGFNPANLSGIDSDPARIDIARRTIPLAGFQVADASHLPFDSGSFDLVFESTMLGTLDSQSLLESIAQEMIRVARPGGYVMLADWRYSREGSGVKTAITPELISRVFGVGTTTEVVTRIRGALAPPLGRRLSRAAPSLYFVVQALFPFAAAQVTTVLRKT
jgi:ubiquinone/menaquinone biosynthesis C-methylase UbiE